VLTACQQAPSNTTPPDRSQRQVSVSATFATPEQNAAALTYDPKLLPVGAQATVIAGAQGGKTTVELAVSGLLPNHAYGAHAHARPCGPDGDAAGPHYQHQLDPKTPSVDPAFANPRNEIWLDFTTDADGKATAASTVDWIFDARKADSVIIHAQPTATEAGKAGTAGPRLGCMNVDF
jgi:Cu-Zn family superoxide dismutase